MSTPENQVGTISTEPAGATIQTTYMGRGVRALAVTDSKLDMVSSLNTRATIFVSVASTLIALGLGIWVSAAFTPENGVTAEGKVLMHFGAPIAVLLGIVFVVLACLEFRLKGSMLDTIRSGQGEKDKSTG